VQQLQTLGSKPQLLNSTGPFLAPKLSLADDFDLTARLKREKDKLKTVQHEAFKEAMQNSFRKIQNNSSLTTTFRKPHKSNFAVTVPATPPSLEEPVVIKKQEKEENIAD
jgi:hypothetical protein